MPDDDPRGGDGGEDQRFTLWDLAFAAVLVAAMLAYMMLWAVRTLGCWSC